MFGWDDTSSSLVTVEADRESRSGVDVPTGSAVCVEFVEDVWDSPLVLGCSVEGSVSASSAQLFTWVTEAVGALEVSSFAGVAEPEAGLLTETGLEMPFAACAYENVAAISKTVDALANELYRKQRWWQALKIPGGTARFCWPVQVLALVCPERQTDLSALYAG
jgi:hypothetical protein